MKIKNIIYFIFFALINLNAENQEERERVKEKLVYIINNINNLSVDQIKNMLPEEYDFWVRAGGYDEPQKMYIIYAQEISALRELKNYLSKKNVFDEGPINAFYFFKKCQGEECLKMQYTKLFIFNRRDIDQKFSGKFIEDENLDIENGRKWDSVEYIIRGKVKTYNREEEEKSYNKEFNDILSENE